MTHSDDDKDEGDSKAAVVINARSTGAPVYIQTHGNVDTEDVNQNWQSTGYAVSPASKNELFVVSLFVVFGLTCVFGSLFLQFRIADGTWLTIVTLIGGITTVISAAFLVLAYMRRRELIFSASLTIDDASGLLEQDRRKQTNVEEFAELLDLLAYYRRCLRGSSDRRLEDAILSLSNDLQGVVQEIGRRKSRRSRSSTTDSPMLESGE